jgi:hypothetical protein
MAANLSQICRSIPRKYESDKILLDEVAMKMWKNFLSR